MAKPTPIQITRINHATFNSQQDALVISSDRGVKVFNTCPLVLMRSIDAKITGNAKMACILHRSNLICFVGGGKDTKYPANTAMIWDDENKEIVLEYTVPGGPITNVMMSSTRIVIMQDKKVHIFAFPNQSKLIRAEEIRYNPTGLAAMSISDLTGQQLVFPGFKLGTIRIMNLLTVSGMESLAPCDIDAHLTEIAGIAINVSGTMVATGSTKGTVVRVFDTRTKRLMNELRRGNVQATLHCLAFSPCSSYLSVSSDKGTIHIFCIRNADETTPTGQVLRHVGISGSKDVAKFRLESKVLACAFTNVSANSKALQSIVPICADGSYHSFSFNPDGHVQRESYELLLQLADEQDFVNKLA